MGYLACGSGIILKCRILFLRWGGGDANFCPCLTCLGYWHGVRWCAGDSSSFLGMFIVLLCLPFTSVCIWRQESASPPPLGHRRWYFPSCKDLLQACHRVGVVRGCCLEGHFWGRWSNPNIFGQGGLIQKYSVLMGAQVQIWYVQVFCGFLSDPVKLLD